MGKYLATYAVFRGGSFNSYGSDCTVSIRYGTEIEHCDVDIGFRVVLYIK